MCEPIVKPSFFEPHELRPGQEARVGPVDAVGDDVRGRRHVQAVQDRRCVPEDVAVAVVEGDHHRSRGQRLPVLERLERLELADGVVTVAGEPFHLRLEVRGRDGQALRDRGKAWRQRPDPVVHQDRKFDRPGWKRLREPQNAATGGGGRGEHERGDDYSREPGHNSQCD